jgi:hypothetical protein
MLACVVQAIRDGIEEVPFDCSYKEQYRTMDRALQVARRMARNKNQTSAAEAYRCWACRWFHVGHNPRVMLTH